MKRFFAIVIFLVGLAVAAPLRAQVDPEIARQAAALSEGPALSAFLARSSASGVSDDFVLGVLQEARNLEARGIPAEPYLLKANEGLAKGIAPEKIAPALRQTRQRGESALEIVDRAVPSAAGLPSAERRRAILQVQSALLNGKSPSDLEREIKSAAPGGKPNWGQVAQEARALQPRRHAVQAMKAPPKREEKFKPPPKPRDAEALGLPEFNKKEKEKPEQDKSGRKDLYMSEKHESKEKAHSGKGPSKSKGHSGNRGHGKGK